jgi:hypothetical protein
MKVWKDIISGDEMVSDSYPQVETFDGACIEVKSRLLTKKANEDFGISGKSLHHMDKQRLTMVYR